MKKTIDNAPFSMPPMPSMPQKTTRARAALTLASALAALALALAIGPTAVTARAMMPWMDVPAGDLKATASTIQPDAGAEVLYRLKQVDDSNVGSATTDEYWRIKIYNENGISALSKIEISYDPKTERIKDLAARVIKPDGSKIDLDKKAFYDREVVKEGKSRTRMFSFSFPALEPGAIVEYQFQRATKNNIFALRFDFASDMPVRSSLFQFRPVRFERGYTTKGFYHLCNANRLRRAAGFYCYEMNNLKAFVEEPFMPPADDVRPWMVYYPTYSISHADYWNKVADGLSQTTDACIKKGGQLARDTAAQITRGVAPGPAQADALNDFCRAQIVNIDTDPPPGPPDPKLNTKDPRAPDDILKTKKGRAQEIQILFVALAQALGLDARPVVCSRRGDGVFSPELHMDSCLPSCIVAVKFADKDKWHFYDPAHREVDTGMLLWDNEGQEALIPDPGGSWWETTPVSPPGKSREKRIASLKLDADGTLSGDVRIEATGHDACLYRLRYMTETQAKIEEKARERLQTRMPGAEITSVTASGPADVLKPFVLAYKVSVPNYAEQSGQRIFVQPGFFTKGEPPWFTAATRTHDICFPYADVDEDEVSIGIPDGCTIEEGSAPQGIERTDWGQYVVTLGFRPKSRVIVYKRTFEYSKLQTPAAEYDAIKKLYDFIHTQDTHTLTLKKDN